MSTASPSNKVEVGSISDRGLSDKRPLNEDSYLADAGRGIFGHPQSALASAAERPVALARPRSGPTLLRVL